MCMCTFIVRPCGAWFLIPVFSLFWEVGEITARGDKGGGGGGGQWDWVEMMQGDANQKAQGHPHSPTRAHTLTHARTHSEHSCTHYLCRRKIY